VVHHRGVKYAERGLALDKAQISELRDKGVLAAPRPPQGSLFPHTHHLTWLAFFALNPELNPAAMGSAEVKFNGGRRSRIFSRHPLCCLSVAFNIFLVYAYIRSQDRMFKSLWYTRTWSSRLIVPDEWPNAVAGPLKGRKDASIVLVGSSPNVLESGKGPLVDKMDLVVRFNQAAFHIDGLDKDVGKRTDLIWLNDWVAQKVYNELEATNNAAGIRSLMYSTHNAHVDEDVTDAGRIAAIKNFAKYEVFVTTRDFTESSKNFVRDQLKLAPEYFLHLRSGTLAVLYFVQLNFRSISLHGFEVFEKKAEQKHFFDKEKGSDDHDVALEVRLLQKLVHDGRIKLL
jgi:hypothetical protein